MVEDLVPILVPIFVCCVLPIAVVAIIFAPILAVAIRKALEKNHLFLFTDSAKTEPAKEPAPAQETLPEPEADAEEPKAEETGSNA